jgi:hypothetical protein
VEEGGVGVATRYEYERDERDHGCESGSELVQRGAGWRGFDRGDD